MCIVSDDGYFAGDKINTDKINKNNEFIYIIKFSLGWTYP